MKLLRQFLYGRSCQKFEEVAKGYESILKQQKDFWNQWAKHWLAYSDINSRYFHVTVTAKKKKNSFESLIDNSGQEKE